MFKKLGLSVSLVLNGVALSEERVRAQVTKTQMRDRKVTVMVKKTGKISIKLIAGRAYSSVNEG